MLVDMHIPDWDPAFLSRYDPPDSHSKKRVISGCSFVCAREGNGAIQDLMRLGCAPTTMGRNRLETTTGSTMAL